MATFTKIEELFDQFPQSVGGNPTEGGNGNEAVRIFQPDRGLDVLIYNTDYIDRALDDHTTGISASFDDRQTLGTITLNNRDFWENSNYNKNSFQPFLRKGKETVRNQVIITDGNGDEIVFNEDRKYSTFKFSIDAIPFVINPNTDEIVRLDRYYDKNIDSEHDIRSLLNAKAKGGIHSVTSGLYSRHIAIESWLMPDFGGVVVEKGNQFRDQSRS